MSLQDENRPELYLKTELVPRTSITAIKSDQLMPYSEIIAVCFDIDTERINTLCGENIEMLNVKPCGTYP